MGAYDVIAGPGCDHTSIKKAPSFWESRKYMVSTCALLVTFFVGQQFFRALWKSLGEGLQAGWEKAHDFFEGDQFAMYVWGSLIILLTCYWSVGSIFSLLVLTGRPSHVFGHKSQGDVPHKKYPMSVECLRQVVNQVLFNQTFVGVPIFISCFYIRKWRGFDDSIYLPPIYRVIIEFILCMVIEEIVYYFSHRLLRRHHLYRRYYKVHDEGSSPVSITSVYCHPLEHVLSSVLPVFLGPALLGSHVTLQWFWVMMATFFSVFSQSGHQLPFLPSPEAPGYPHYVCNQEYCGVRWMDCIHGGDRFIFRNGDCYRRHGMLLKFYPVRKRHTDKIRVKPDD